MENKVIVIGAVNMDICGTAEKELIMRDSNPGSVSMTVGGVGHNIAVNLRNLGLGVKLIAAIGSDLYGEGLLKSCLDDGLDMSLARYVEGSSSCYLYINDEKGDLALAVCDTDISGCIDPEYLSRHLDEINAADALVIDGNLPPETLVWIADNVTVPLYADPVSVRKSERLIPVLPKLRAIKPNDLEAMYMTGEPSPEKAALSLLKSGVKRVFVSLGECGMIAAEGDSLITLPCSVTKLVNTAGAGDAATAAMVWAGIRGLSLEDTAIAANRAAAAAIACSAPINPLLREADMTGSTLR